MLGALQSTNLLILLLIATMLEMTGDAVIRTSLVPRYQMTVTMTTISVRVCGAELDTDEIQESVAHPAFRDDLLRELAYALHGSLEHDGLDALLVVQMRVHGRYGEVMMGVLDAGQSLGELAFVVVVDV